MQTDTLPLPPRFELRRRLGQGGFGSVFAAFDHQRGGEVAIKALTRSSPEGMLRFKAEFRTLSGLTHRNLVALFDLFADEPPWFYSMELIEGRPLGLVVADATGQLSVEATFDLPSSTLPPALERVAGPTVGAPIVERALDLGLLRALFRQLAEGVAALHRSGRVHRDIKPSNVLVTDEGRVVILDYGLVTTADERDVLRAGTPDFVAPEQVDGHPSFESDWYSFGVMLHLALTGRLPFRGGPDEVLAARRAFDGPDPRESVEGLPDDLATLARELLRRDPAARPSGSDVLASLGGAPRQVRAPTFVGRERERAQIHRAIAHHDASMVFVSGASGIGKSATLQRAVADLLVDDPTAIVLTGRCHQREVVPFPGLDGLIDALTRYLRTIPDADVYEMLPPGVRDLARLFPVLRQVRPIDLTADAELDTPDPRESRRRAGRALRHLLSLVAQRGTLVLILDDVQWGDADSASLLVELIRPPATPHLHLLMSIRPEGLDAEIPRALRNLEESPYQEHLTLEGLSEADARAIAAQIFDDEERIAQAVEEAAGQPLFLDGLARVGAAGPKATLDSLIAAQIDELPPAARRVLDILAVAGRPLPRAQLRHAARIGAAFLTALAALEAGRLARTRGNDDTDVVEPWHDRIREVIVPGVPAEDLVVHHRALAEASRLFQANQLESLLLHLEASGERDEAARYALQAADHAAEAMALDHAAGLYRKALDLGAPAARVLPRLARALADGGRSFEAGTAWIQAAAVGPEDAHVAHRREAASAWLQAGHLEQGLGQLEWVLGQHKMGLGTSRPLVWMDLLRARGALWWRGCAPPPRPQAAPDALAKVDACWTAATGLAAIDPIRAAAFHTRHLHLALDAGEPRRIALGLCLEAAWVMEMGRPGLAPAIQVIGRARDIARGRWDDPHLEAMLHLTEGLLWFQVGRQASSEPSFARAEALLRERCTGVAWELNTARTHQGEAARWAGEFTRVERLLQRFARDAERGGNILLATYVAHARAATLYTARDDSQTGRHMLQETLASLPDERVGIPLRWEITAQAEIDLYDRKPADALERLDSTWKRLQRGQSDHGATVQADLLHLRLRALLATASEAEGSAQRRLLARARADLRQLTQLPVDAAQPLALLGSGLLRAAEHHTEAAITDLSDAEAAFRTVEAMAWADVAARARGRLIGGEEGREIVLNADARLRERGVAAPTHFAWALCPVTEA